jgi:Ca-activated chloride channel family protein
MTFLPLLPWPALLVLLAAVLAAVWWNPAGGGVPGETWGRHARLSAAAVLLAVVALRPALPGGQVEAMAANLNVYFVVDTTSSMVAEDYGGERPRLEGVRADVLAIAAALPGARYGIVTFDSDARVRLPLTTDTTALEAAVETLAPEPSELSRGSTVTEANDRLAALLTSADKGHPERGRIVFYLGDGEQTAAGEPAPFTIAPGLVQGGAVLGYGTAQGGRMKGTVSRYGTGTDYIRDPSTGEDALSVIDEDRLRQLAQQLGVGYVHRTDGETVDALVAGIDAGRFGTAEERERAAALGREELYWVPLLGVAGIAAWELGCSGASLLRSRRREVRP